MSSLSEASDCLFCLSSFRSRASPVVVLVNFLSLSLGGLGLGGRGRMGGRGWHGGWRGGWALCSAVRQCMSAVRLV